MKNLVFILLLTCSFNHLNAQESEEFYEEGKKFSDSKDFLRATLSYSRAIQLNPYDWRYYQSRAWAYYKTKNLKLAIEDLNICLDLKPKYENLDALNLRGKFLLENGNYTSAIGDWTYIITSFPDESVVKYGIAHFFRGQAYLYSNQKAKACTDFNDSFSRRMADAQNFIEKFCK